MMIRCWSHCHRLAIAIGILIICSDVNAFDNNVTQPDDLRDGPIIVDSLKGGTLRELTLYRGQNLTLLCKANKPIQLIQHELPEEKIGSDFVMVQKNVSSPDPDYKYAQELELYNVDRFAVGYYGCFDNSIKENFGLANITEELNNTEHAAYFYLYVDGTDSMFAPMREVVIASIGSKVVIGCRPMTPDTNVTLSLLQSNKAPEFLMYSPKIGYLVKARYSYKCEGRRENQYASKTIRYSGTGPPKPKVEGIKYFLEGETFTLNCTVKYQSNVATVLTWIIPRGYVQGVYNHTNERAVGGGEILYNNITIADATKADAGTYICVSKNGPGQQQTTFEKVFTESFINLTKGNKKDVIETNTKVIILHTTINAYPPAEVVFYKDGQEIPKNTEKYSINRRPDSVDLVIRKLNVNDTGNYTLVARNKYVTSNVMYDVRKYDAPTIYFGTESKAFPLNTTATLQCEAVGYPLPKLSWFFTNENGVTQQLAERNREELSLIKVISQIQIPVRVSGNITCQASNSFNTVNSSKAFHVYEISNGFGIKDRDKTWFAEGQRAQLTCLASKYDYKNLTWVGNDDEDLYEYVQYSASEFSHIAVLVIDNISLDQEGNYTCVGINMDNLDESESILITVEATLKPIIKEPQKDQNLEVNPYQPVHFGCEVVAVPPPTLTWHKDGSPLNSSDVEIYTEYVDHSIVNSTVFIRQMLEESKGKYECVATSGSEITKRAYNLQIKEKSTYMPIYFSICGGVAFILIILVMYLAWKIRKEKQFRKELAEAGLLYFKEGVTKSLNPDLGISEQAELLPYDERFEFPPEKLILGKQLGAGAFGVVYKAEARGIINAEETTPVAVKMVKKNADNMYIRALASELKIMVHLGKHINIVNLLGACTKNVGKRELIVIVEYCKFGNIHEYMQRHREVFIDQLTDNKEKNLGRVNKAFSCSSGSSGMHSDYFGSNHTQETDHTFVTNTHRSERKVSETGYVQPEWRSNYRSDYSFDGRSPRPLTSRDLLAWAFQIARGMEYLANRKVLHGDLAARNVLLAEDNIVKICDFGLARSIYKNDEYQKKENSPLPVKWLAIECMTDRIFSTQSDVWSFGIVLWELFSLAKTPYPNISPQDLLHWLNDGHRLEKPPYADDRLYDVMRRCWEQRPIARPSFTQLQSILGSFLEDNVRNHYVDLNMAYKDTNEKPEGEDYLAMVCAPDYNNMVPSPHPYVNETPMFFHPNPSPSQLQHDDEGYLQMSPANQIPFSPRAPGTKFDFDARKLNPRVTDASVHGSELTPMLTLNNLPARSGSESDHDGNSSPYLKMCPRIVEENDEVFETKNNLKNSQNTAVSNPTYSTFDVDLEKKPNNISNNYINVNVPNGLVK